LVPCLLRDLRLLTSGLLLSGFVISATWRVVTASRRDDPWNTGDWLIDYSSGFVRRGLFGSLIGLFSWSPASATTMIVGTQLALILFVTTFVIANVMRAPASMAIVAVALSPSFLLFGVLEPEAAFRKEWLGLASLTALLIAVEPRATRRRRQIALTGSMALFALGVLSHEATVVLLAAFLWVLARSNWPRRERLRFFAAFASFSLVAALLAALFRGSEELSMELCRSLIDRGFDPVVCTGAIDWLGRTTGSTFSSGDYLFGLRLPLLLPVAIFASAPLALFNWTRMQVLAFLSISSAIVVPLGLVSLDHGRWLWLAATTCTLIALPEIRRNEVTGLNLPSAVVFVLVFSWTFGHEQPRLRQLPVFNRLLQTLSEVLG
jgi:hypothetical protein